MFSFSVFSSPILLEDLGSGFYNESPWLIPQCWRFRLASKLFEVIVVTEDRPACRRACSIVAWTQPAMDFHSPFPTQPQPVGRQA